MSRYITFFYLMLLCSISFASHAFNLKAEEKNFSLNIGSFFTDSGLNFQLDSDISGPGTPINFEEDLGLDNDETVLRIDGHFWFNCKHRLDFSYFDLKREANRTIDEVIEFGDETFSINTTVHTNFSTGIYKIGYSYFFDRQGKWHLGALFGLYIMDITASISATSSNQSEVSDVTTLLPVLGFRAEYALTQDIDLKGSYEYFTINPDDDLDGRLADYLIAVEYQLFRNGGIGLAYNRLNFDVNVSDSPLRLDTDWTYDGYMVYLILRY